MDSFCTNDLMSRTDNLTQHTNNVFNNLTPHTNHLTQCVNDGSQCSVLTTASCQAPTTWRHATKKLNKPWTSMVFLQLHPPAKQRYRPLISMVLYPSPTTTQVIFLPPTVVKNLPTTQLLKPLKEKHAWSQKSCGKICFENFHDCWKEKGI